MDVIVRRLQKGDLQNGFLTSLDALKRASDIDSAKAEEIFQRIDQNQDYLIAVAEKDGKIIGTATLIVEQKFIHEGGRVGHIEDVAVSKESQERGIGSKIMKHLLEEAKKRGCYKTILDCTEEVVPFEKKVGFKPGIHQMRFDHI
ncbi:MAG: GNAT family N-acetyltransferase [Nitrosopumilus sp. B06]|nr:MAG: GNAT family N-acetyltransferase [Nitrosopumilus sp. D6]RNJ80331.1 MAG: GNAT family N-acetyltransferase [Nitrosopumilus sp. B06]